MVPVAVLALASEVVSCPGKVRLNIDHHANNEFSGRGSGRPRDRDDRVSRHGGQG